ncbi:probable ATP-dependent RNA helicase DHX58 [Engraulis encrasicolus]|uniref:probable ATP-dependent RNA helicase DHX58 n=1 Tax=Engraulis encrasicolus TaxID=184585 RepID=UPI002FD290CA
MADLNLRDYQLEVVQRAVARENVIIWLPTGGGKTRAAVYVAKHHLKTTPNAKVAVLVNKVHLVDQHYSNEFRDPLRAYQVSPISGDSEEKNFFGCVVKDSDVVICTAQILQNALTNMEEGKHADLTDFTLLIIDECHHTNKDHTYNKIMAQYVKSKMKGERRLPQILGLTASPGTGGGRTIENAVKHVLEICANLDSIIVSTENYKPELIKVVPKPVKRYDIVVQRPQDPFADHLKDMMKMIHDFMSADELISFRLFGTQEYEQDVMQLRKLGEMTENRLLSQCGIHLRKYNDALFINDTVRTVDALRFLEDFYDSKEGFALDGVDTYLAGLFEANRRELKLLVDTGIENPKLVRLAEALLEQFRGPSRCTKCIIFSKTRQGTHYLWDWVKTNPRLMDADIKPAPLVGAGTGETHMTQNKQKDTITMFRQNKYNLLISTSVAEEGLDIPECNMVVRYGLLTNEIAQQQARGRARAEDSVYSVVATAGSREVRREKTNEYLEELTGEAVTRVQRMERDDRRTYQRRIAELQKAAVIERAMAAHSMDRARHRYTAAQVQLSCRQCFTVVASGSDISIIENSHHVIINSDFKDHYTTGGTVVMERAFEDWEPGRKIFCRRCKKDWGMEIKFKKVAILPCIAITSFSIKTPQDTLTPKKWKNVPFPVEEFDFLKYMESLDIDLD